MKYLSVVLSLGVLAALMVAPSLDAQSVATESQHMTPKKLWELGRVGAGSFMPDGKTVLHSVRRYDVAENKGDSDLWVAKLGGGDPFQLTEGPGSEGAAVVVKSKKGDQLVFLAKRGDDKSTQAWAMHLKDRTFTRVTNLEGGIANLKVAPTGDRIAFTRNVKLDKTVNELYADLPKADARIIDSLMYRHWDSWHDYRYSHLFTAPLDENLVAGAAVDLMEGLKVDCPVPPFAGSEHFNFSPDGKEIAFTMKIAKDWATSTDSDVYVRPADGSGRTRNLTSGMDGYDNDPIYSPNGKYLVIQSMERPGFESDKNRILRIDRKTGEMLDFTRNMDQTSHGLVISPDSKTIYFHSEWRGCTHIFRMDLESSDYEQLTRGAYNWRLDDISADSKTLLVGRQNMLRPWELGTLPAKGGDFSPVTGVNDSFYETKLKDQASIGERWVKATDGKNIHCWVIYPPNFDPKKKYPMITYFQGGPQGQIGQWFSYRWNFHLMAAQGYVVLAPNRRGLPGFGRAWNDEISKDWGGQAMRDLLSAHDDMLTEPYIDADRCAGVGASFGGYTAYWMMGNAGDRFTSMISHCGVFNLESMYGTTEELFFVDWDIGGPYWRHPEVREKNEKFSPNRFIGNWKTPLLVIHGEKDFRVPIGQGMEAFTAAQLEGVPSRFLYYPQEGHWVLSPQNGLLWHRVFFDWLERHTKNKK